jgi:amidase
MYTVPDVDEVVAVARELGIHLGPDEAVKYREYLIEQMKQLDTFVQARVEEPKPPMGSAAREPGHRPSPEEDPLNAWMWKCRIEGAAEGLLAGKTVSFKDHIAVAGIPMSFGSFALEGFIPDFDATVVTRVLKEGGTIIGKNVMNGLSGGFGTGGGIGDYGRPLNPHNHDHVTGGSSSGSAAAVAAHQKGPWPSSKPGSSAPSPGPTTQPPSSLPLTSCGPPRPTCSRHAASCRSLPPR